MREDLAFSFVPKIPRCRTLPQKASWVFLVLAMCGSVIAHGKEREAGYYAFVFKSAFGTSIFRLGNEELKNIQPAGGVAPWAVGLGTVDVVIQNGKRKYASLLLDASELPIIGYGTNWLLCYRTNSPWRDSGSSKKVEYCMVSLELLTAGKSTGHVVWRGEEIPTADLKSVAVLQTGMHEVAWGAKIVVAAAEYFSTNRPSSSHPEYSIVLQHIPHASDWLGLCDQVTLNSYMGLQHGYYGNEYGTFEYVRATELDQVIQGNRKSDAECVLVAKQLEEALAEEDKRYREWKQAAENEAAGRRKEEASQDEREKKLLSELTSKASGQPRGGLKVKGFFLGQNITQAVDQYNSQYAAKNTGLLPIRLRVNPFGGFFAYGEVLFSGDVLFYAGEDGQLNRIVIRARASDVMFATAGMSAERFVDEFSAAYKVGTFKVTSEETGLVWTCDSSKGFRIIIKDKTVEIMTTPSERETKFN
jgi:hypothetical protein